MNKQIIHDALVLTAFTLVIGIILGAVYGITMSVVLLLLGMFMLLGKRRRK